jgi:hypothetical protein
VRAELARAFGDDLLTTTIRRSVRVGEAQTAEMPITAYYKPKDLAPRLPLPMTSPNRRTCGRACSRANTASADTIER